MHYVLKNKFKDGLVASAEELMDEFYRAQDHILSIDQNNLGEPTVAIPNTANVGLSGISRDSFVAPSFEDSVEGRDSLTRWHYMHSTSGATNIETSDQWTDQVGYAKVTFASYRACPYLLIGFAQLAIPRTDNSANPLRASLSIRLDGEVLGPGHHVSYSRVDSTGGANIKAPLMFMTTKMLFPGEHTAMVTVKQSPGGSAQVSCPGIAAIGFVR